MSPYRTPGIVEAPPRGPRWATRWKRFVVRFARVAGVNYTWRIERGLARMQRQIERMKFENDVTLMRLVDMEHKRIERIATARVLQQALDIKP